jgi:nitrogen-specific signal transduction histidine kinase
MKAATSDQRREPKFLMASWPNVSPTLGDVQIVAPGGQHRQYRKLTPAYRALIVERQRYHELRELIRDGYVETDTAGIIQEANTAAATLFNIPLNTLLGQSLLSFIVEGEKEAFFSRLLHSDRIEEREMRIQPQGCPSCFVCVTVAAVCNGEGEKIGLRWLLRRDADREAGSSTEQNRETAGSVSKIMDPLVHQVLNDLQSISMELDCLSFSQPQAPTYATIFQRIEQASRLLREGREYFLSSKPHFCIDNPAAVLETCIRPMEAALRRQGIRLHMVCCDSLPRLLLDQRQFQSAIERVLACSCALLPQGGELQVEAGGRVIDGQRYVELRISSIAPAPMRGIPTDVFRPFLRINAYQAGLSLLLARQILHRHHGRIAFQKENAHRGCFTVLLKAQDTA